MIRSSVPAVCLLGALAVLLGPPRAGAEWRPSGAVSAGALVREREVGVAGLLDHWKAFGVFRVGGSLGVAAFPSDTPERSRVFLPLGFSLATVFQNETMGIDLRVRVGSWAGATNAGLRAGGWLSSGVHGEIMLDPRVAFSLGVEGFVTLGHGNAVYVFPALGLVWRP